MTFYDIHTYKADRLDDRKHTLCPAHVFSLRSHSNELVIYLFSHPEHREALDTSSRITHPRPYLEQGIRVFRVNDD